MVYSDASWPQWTAMKEAVEKGKPPRLGWVIFTPGERPRGFSMELGREFLSAFFPRYTQIMAAEAVAVLTALVLTPQAFANRELVWLIDNESALSSLIRGGSKAEDVGHVAAFTQLAMLEHSRAAWYELVDSASNPADGLSEMASRTNGPSIRGGNSRGSPPRRSSRWPGTWAKGSSGSQGQRR